MSSFLPLLAEIGSIEKTAITVLAVAGGFLIGYLLTGLIAHILSKLMLQKQTPPRLGRFLKLAGGTGAAIAVYLLFSGEGGFGFGGKGGNGEMNVNAGKDSTSQPKQETRREEPKKTDSKPKDEELHGKPLSVYVLGVDSVNNRNFRFEDDPQALTAEEIIERIEQLDKAGNVVTRLIEIKAGTDALSVPQYSKIYSRLLATFEPRGFKIIPLTGTAGKDLKKMEPN
jgi:hypothetical protein